MNTEIEHNDEIDVNIRRAVNPSGHPASLRERDRAARYLLEHADIAYGRLMALVQENPESLEAPRLIELVGLFRRAESVAPLGELLLQGIPDTSRAAGRALAAIDTVTAQQALKEGLQSDLDEVRIAAIDGVRLTGDKAWCPLLCPALQDKDANLRYYAVNTAAELGCLDAEQLQEIARHDDDEYVRQLASGWVKDTD